MALRTSKARKALAKMGPSVMHGGISTLLAISMLGFTKNFGFVYFFRSWLLICLFGLANALILLPVLLSILGPVGETEASQDY